MKWTKEQEKKVIKLRKKNITYKEIAKKLNRTISSVKHKYRRLKQATNENKYHHPIEKTKQVHKILNKDKLYSILETNAGWGNLTKVYVEYGNVIAQDIKQDRINYLKENVKNDNKFVTIKCDSFKKIHNYIYEGVSWDVIDLDPYGYPSRYFPHILKLIKDGYLFMTIPKLGVQQINKITKAHLEVFWDFRHGKDNNDDYLNIVTTKLEKYALGYKRKLLILDILELDRVFRLACRVEKKSMLELVDLTVTGIND